MESIRRPERRVGQDPVDIQEGLPNLADEATEDRDLSHLHPSSLVPPSPKLSWRVPALSYLHLHPLEGFVANFTNQTCWLPQPTAVSGMGLENVCAVEGHDCVDMD